MVSLPRYKKFHSSQWYDYSIDGASSAKNMRPGIAKSDLPDTARARIYLYHSRLHVPSPASWDSPPAVIETHSCHSNPCKCPANFTELITCKVRVHVRLKCCHSLVTFVLRGPMASRANVPLRESVAVVSGPLGPRLMGEPWISPHCGEKEADFTSLYETLLYHLKVPIEKPQQSHH